MSSCRSTSCTYLRSAAVGAEKRDTAGDLGSSVSHRTGVAGGAEVLARVEARAAARPSAPASATGPATRPAIARHPRRRGAGASAIGSELARRAPSGRRGDRDDRPRAGRHRRLDRGGSMRRCSASTSTSTGTAPIRDTASAVAMKVFAGRMTSSPGPDPDGAERQLERIGAVGDPDTVLDPDVLGVLLLERGDLGTTDERGSRRLVDTGAHPRRYSACCAARSTRGNGQRSFVGTSSGRAVRPPELQPCRARRTAAPARRPRSRRLVRRPGRRHPSRSSRPHRRTSPLAHGRVHAKVGRAARCATPPPRDTPAANGGEVLKRVVVRERHVRA